MLRLRLGSFAWTLAAQHTLDLDAQARPGLPALAASSATGAHPATL